MRVLLIAGHGDGDCGACGNGYEEQHLTREVVSLISNIVNVDVFDTSKNPYQYIKNNGFDFTPYDYVLEIHFNAGVNDSGNGVTTGVEVLYSPTLPITINNDICEVVADLGFKNRGLKARTNLSNMNRCVNQNTPYGLLEVCFIDDLDDVKLYQKTKNDIAERIADILAENFKLSYKSNYIEEDNMEDLKKEIERLKQIINIMGGEIQELKNPMIYNYVDDNMPGWAKPTIQKLMDEGKLKGNEKGELGLTEDMLKILVIMNR